MESQEPVHVPVMVGEVLELLAPERGDLFVDCTVGLGGHAEALLARAPQAHLVGIDRDPQALEVAQRRLADFADRVQLVEGEFSRLRQLLESLGIESVSGIFADLGVSSLQLDRGERGFSFRFDGPLDMRMGPGARLTAAEIVNSYSEGELEDIIRRYGEEKRARRIARAVVGARQEQSIETTGELRDIIHSEVGPRSGRTRHGRGGIDSATRTFQALRIEVNEELAGLEELLDQAMSMLEGDGRLVVISYHSLEDRIVKTAFRDAAIGEIDPVTGRPRAETRLIEILTRKPARPSEAEVQHNPRSRSARLRAARRL